MSFRVEITDTYVHVFEQKVRHLRDEETGEVITIPDGGHGSAIGAGDYADPADFTAAVAAIVTQACGKDLAKVVAGKAAETAAANAAIATATANLTDLQTQIDGASKRLADLHDLARATIDAIAVSAEQIAP
jgi:hypothetical protein